MASLVDDGCEAKCNTCKAIFSSIEKVKEHYRGDWHVFNSKRRSNGLPPLTKDEYKKVKPIIQQNQAPKTVPAVAPNQVMPNKVPEEPSPAKNSEDTKEKLETENNEEGEANEDGEDGEKSQPLPVGPNISIFDNKVFDTTDECLEYMALKFGFFLPDIEYLVDLDGLLVYLGEKVKLGGYCLYCQKLFRPGHPLQNHMISKSHCKIAYEEGVDMEEYEDFYDFTASYEGMEDELDEDGNPIERTLETTSIGELVLPDGRVVGNRAFRQYYRQRFRPEESRASVLAQQREELLRLGMLRFGGGKVGAMEVANMSDTQVMSMLLQHQKAIRKNEMVERRMQQRKYMMDQRQEYQSTVDKLRSRATTTAKIRDYHKTLM